MYVGFSGKSFLCIFLGVDLGTNFPAWERALNCRPYLRRVWSGVLILVEAEQPVRDEASSPAAASTPGYWEMVDAAETL